MTDLFKPQLLGGTVTLKNRIVMPPMTRTRTSEGDLPTDGDLPNALMATYYGQRAGAGLIIAGHRRGPVQSRLREDTRNPLGSPNAGLASGDR